MYTPSSGNRMIEFQAAGVDPSDSATGLGGINLGTTGEFGNGYTESLGCFNFNAYSASLGCDSQSPPCLFQISGVRYDAATQTEQTVTTRVVPISACPGTSNCPLIPVMFDNSFTNLTGVRINATVDGVAKSWWMDDVSLGWSDDSCDADFCRDSNVEMLVKEKFDFAHLFREI